MQPVLLTANQALLFRHTWPILTAPRRKRSTSCGQGLQSIKLPFPLGKMMINRWHLEGFPKCSKNSFSTYLCTYQKEPSKCSKLIKIGGMVGQSSVHLMFFRFPFAIRIKYSTCPSLFLASNKSRLNHRSSTTISSTRVSLVDVLTLLLKDS